MLGLSKIAKEVDRDAFIPTMDTHEFDIQITDLGTPSRSTPRKFRLYITFDSQQLIFFFFFGTPTSLALPFFNFIIIIIIIF